MNNHDNTPETPDTRTRSLGFWMRAAGTALAAEMNRTLAAEGLDRRDWAVLDVLAGERDIPGLVERVQRGGKRVRSLAARGWAAERDGAWTITDEGRRERDRIHELVRGVRDRTRGAVTDEDFATTVASLEAIARELGWHESSPRRFGPRGRHGLGRGFGHGHGCGPRFGEHPRHGEHPHRGERAFERGFTAGFAAGRDAA
ncbi:hypothetical protein O1W71_06330 [Microbacterium sp. H37-C3]|uniref:MarR family winged helix-turn-helix transcriptional regulator n=1 Tax=Microbacterium sp. H37-C3 TaxID=3004354 RepID=UPI0022AED47E|nr:hypothetical protein [Microbacterium sp. H37-C3]MCZ4067281.1 hypothetical protein [Microbacterium sp. H37-C3]